MAIEDNRRYLWLLPGPVLSELLLFRHKVVASCREAFDKDWLLNVLARAEFLQRSGVVANRGVDHADQQVRIHRAVGAQIHDKGHSAGCSLNKSQILAA